MEKKRGRPIANGSKKHRVEIRLNDEEAASLDDICINKGETKSEILLKALKMYHNLSKFQR